MCNNEYSKSKKRPPTKRPKIGLQAQLSLNAGEHSTILSTFIKLPFVIKNFVLSTFEWPFKTGFTECLKETKSATMNIFQKKIFSF